MPALKVLKVQEGQLAALGLGVLLVQLAQLVQRGHRGLVERSGRPVLEVLLEK